MTDIERMLVNEWTYKCLGLLEFANQIHGNDDVVQIKIILQAKIKALNEIIEKF